MCGSHKSHCLKSTTWPQKTVSTTNGNIPVISKPRAHCRWSFFRMVTCLAVNPLTLMRGSWSSSLRVRFGGLCPYKPLRTQTLAISEKWSVSFPSHCNLFIVLIRDKLYIQQKQIAKRGSTAATEAAAAAQWAFKLKLKGTPTFPVHALDDIIVLCNIHSQLYDRCSGDHRGGPIVHCPRGCPFSTRS